MADIQTVQLRRNNSPPHKEQVVQTEKETSGEISPRCEFPDSLDNPHNDGELVTTNLPCTLIQDMETKREEPQYIFPHISSFTNLSSLSVQNKGPQLHQRYHKLSMCEYKLSDINEINNEYMDTTQDANICCIGKDIHNCIGLQRIVSILSFYSTNYHNCDAIIAYLSKYNVRKHLVNDYHHMIDKHLNEHNHSQRKCDKQFELIYAKMMEEKQLFCDIGTCNIWLRNNRERELVPMVCSPLGAGAASAADDKLSMFMDLLDTIHCYFLHSVDIGHRIMIQDDNHNYFDPALNTGYDARMKFLRRYLAPKKAIQLKKQIARAARFATNRPEHPSNMAGYLRKESLYLKQLRQRYIVLENGCLYSYKTDKKEELTESIELSGFDHVQISEKGVVGQFELIHEGDPNNRRIFISSSMQELDDWLTALKQNMLRVSHGVKKMADTVEPRAKGTSTLKEVTRFGQRYDYWSQDSIYPKYESIKEEVTANKIYRISMEAFTAAFNKAIHLRSCHKIRNMSVCKDVTNEYDLRWDATPRIDHILAVVLWTDYRILSAEFRRTFDKISKKVYDEFWIWSKFLIESVNAFGERLKKSKFKLCFHAIYANTPRKNAQRFMEYETLFNAPTSMTTKLEIAILNAPKNGIILEVTNYKKLRYFNCSFVSHFGNENERLFIEPPGMNKSYYLNVLSIRNMATNENYGEYLQAMRILDKLFGNNDSLDAGNAAAVCSKQCKAHMGDMISILSREEEEEEAETQGELLADYVMDAVAEWSAALTNITFDSYSNNKIVPLADIKDLFAPQMGIECLVRFDKLNVMFKRLISIHFVIYNVNASCQQAVMNEIAHYQCIAAMLQRINQFKYSKLSEIMIGYRYNKHARAAATVDQELIFAANWKEYQHVIAAEQWEMTFLEDEKVLKIQRTIE